MTDFKFTMQALVERFKNEDKPELAEALERFIALIPRGPESLWKFIDELIDYGYIYGKIDGITEFNAEAIQAIDDYFVGRKSLEDILAEAVEKYKQSETKEIANVQ